MLPTRTSDRPETAFVLAGGGSLGAVEVGMLEALIGHGVVPDLIVGSSVGAVNAAYLAAAPEPAHVARLAAIWRGLRRGDVFPFSPLSGLLGLLSATDHVVDPSRLRSLLESRLPLRNLEEAATTLVVVATDLITGEDVPLSSGSALDAVMASVAIPAIFPPVRIGGRHLADGGLANNTPISTAVQRGARRIVVLPSGLPCAATTLPTTPIGMALHGLSLLIARQLIVDVERFARTATLRIVPPLCPLETTPVDFASSAVLIERAAETTHHWLATGGLDSDAIPGEMRPHAHG